MQLSEGLVLMACICFESISDSTALRGHVLDTTLDIGGGVVSAAIFETPAGGRVVSAAIFGTPAKTTTAINAAKSRNGNAHAFSNGSIPSPREGRLKPALALLDETRITLVSPEIRVSDLAQIGAFSSVFLAPHWLQLRWLATSETGMR